MEIIEIVKERIESNKKMFSKEEIGLICDNIEIFSKVYIVATLDRKCSYENSKKTKSVSNGVSNINDIQTHNYIHSNYKNLQWKTENPCVTGSIPVRGTNSHSSKVCQLYYCFLLTYTLN